jgi:hypothetical protein
MQGGVYFVLSFGWYMQLYASHVGGAQERE